MRRGEKPLTEKPLYLVESMVTGCPYIGEQGEAFLFFRKEEAALKAGEFSDCRVSEPKLYPLEQLGMLCYASGASQMLLAEDGKTESFPIREIDLPLRFYNHKLAETAAHLKQDSLMGSLRELSLCQFLMAAKVKKVQENVRITYGAVRHTLRLGELLYLAFTNLDAFKVWSMEVPGWNPILVSYRKLQMICGEHGFLLDPGGCRLIIDRDLMKKIGETAEERETGKKGESE